jgi:hypothetical protein
MHQKIATLGAYLKMPQKVAPFRGISIKVSQKVATTSGKKPIGGAPFWHMRGAYGMRHQCHATNNSLLVVHLNMRHA